MLSPVARTAWTSQQHVFILFSMKKIMFLTYTRDDYPVKYCDGRPGRKSFFAQFCGRPMVGPLQRLIDDRYSLWDVGIARNRRQYTIPIDGVVEKINEKSSETHASHYITNINKLSRIHYSPACTIQCTRRFLSSPCTNISVLTVRNVRSTRIRR